MYESFFEMKRTPFLRNLPVSELYVDSDTSEIHNRLVYAAQRQLFAVLIGDAGTGKTTALRKLKETLNGTEYAVLYLTDSKLTPRHFYNSLLEQLGLETWFYRGDARKKLHQEIEIMRGVSKRKLVVIVDEGHLLSKEMLEEIRFLMNYKMAFWPWVVDPYVSGSAHASIAICALNCSRQNGSNSLEPLAGHLLLKFESLNLLEMYNEH